MKDHEGCIRNFYRTDKAWYYDSKIHKNPNIMFGMYDPEGGCSGEMSMEWEDIGRKIFIPRLKVFDDAWGVLRLFTIDCNLINELEQVDNECITQDQFVEILLRCGFKDMTPYENPEKNLLKLELTKRIKRFEAELDNAKIELTKRIKRFEAELDNAKIELSKIK